MPDSLRRVLLIEDDPEYTEALVRVLTSVSPGFEVQAYGTLAAGLDALSAFAPGVVLLDLCLPDSSGIETVRTAVARCRPVPVVVLSSSVDEELRRASVHAGAEDALRKDQITSGALARVLITAFDRQTHRLIQRVRDEVRLLRAKMQLLRDQWGHLL